MQPSVETLTKISLYLEQKTKGDWQVYFLMVFKKHVI